MAPACTRYRRSGAQPSGVSNSFIVLNNRRYAALQDFAPVFGFSPSDPVQGTDLPDINFVCLATGQGCDAW